MYYGPLKPIFSASLTDQNGFWIGAGFENQLRIIDNISATFSFMPGIYSQGQEEDLGGWLMFRSGIGLRYDYSDQMGISIIYDHRSSGDIWDYNPGMETMQIKLFKKHNF